MVPIDSSASQKTAEAKKSEAKGKAAAAANKKSAEDKPAGKVVQAEKPQMMKSQFARRNPMLNATKEKSIDKQAFEAMGICSHKEHNDRRSKIRKWIGGGVFLLVIIVLVVVNVVDSSIPEPGIELPMIKEFKSLPTGMTRKQYSAMTTWSHDTGMTEPFPLHELVLNHTIKIDVAF